MLRVVRAIGIILEDIVEVFEARKIMWQMYHKKAEEIKEGMKGRDISRGEIHYYMRRSEKLPMSKK